VSLAAALSIAQIALPVRPILTGIAGQMGAVGIVGYAPVLNTTSEPVPLLWLIACAAIIVSYARRPAPCIWADACTASASSEPTPAAWSQGDRQRSDLS
jgi:hypothetical protein